MSNATQTNTRIGALPMVSAADLTGKEARLVALGSTGVNLPAAVTDLALLLVTEVVSATEVTAEALSPERNIRIVAKGTGSKGAELVLAAIAGNDAGKVRAKPSTAGKYFRAAIAEEDFVDGQLVLCRPAPAMVDVGGYRGAAAAVPDDAVEGDTGYNTTTKAFWGKDNAGVKIFQSAAVLFLLMFALFALLGAPYAAAADRTPMVQIDAAKGTVNAAVLADNVKIPGTLEVVGATTLTGNVTMSGSVTASGFIGRVSRTMAYTDFTDNTNTTGYCDITAQVPAGSVVLGWKAVASAGFAGDTTAVVEVGKSGATSCFSTTTNGSVAAPGTVGSASVLATSFCAAATTVRVTVTGGADFTSINAGSMTVTVFYAY